MHPVGMRILVTNFEACPHSCDRFFVNLLGLRIDPIAYESISQVDPLPLASRPIESFYSEIEIIEYVIDDKAKRPLQLAIFNNESADDVTS